MKGNVIQMNTLHLNSVRLNGIGKVQSVSLKGGSTEDPVFPPVEPPIEPEPTPTYTLSAAVTNGKVSAKRNGSAVNLPFTANEGDTIIVEVTPNDGYTFEGWNDGNTDNPRSITMTADVVLSAQCVEVVAPPVGKYIQFEDAEVERVLMSKGVSSDGVGITIEDAERVTSIGTWFANNKTITSFDEFVYFIGVTELVHNAFLDSSLVSISLPNSLKTIKRAAFARCYNLVGDFIIPQVETLEQAAFMSTAITSVYAPNVVAMTGGNAEGVFRKCQALKKVTLGKVADIPRECFADCSNLTEVEIEWDNVKEIAQDAFIRCTSLPRFDIGGNVTSIGGGAFYYCSSLQLLICRATTPPSLAHTNAFTNTNNCPIYVPDASLEAYKTAVNWSAHADRIHPLSEIEGSPYIQFEDAEVERVLMANGVSSDGIGITKEDAENVASIGEWFKNNTTATSFNEINYFKNVKTIQAGAFYKATNLVIDDLNLPNLDKIYYGAFNSTKLKKISSLGNVTQFMNAAASLGGTFQNCGDLTMVSHNVFANITNLGDSAFMQCTNLRIDLILPHLEGVMTSAFSKTPIRRVLDLGKITAFFADAALVWATMPFGSEYEVLIIPPSVERIGRYAFAGDGNMKALVVKANNPPVLASLAFSQSTSTCGVYVPTDSVDSYKEAWASWANRIKPIGDLATDNPTLYAEIQQYL